MMMLRDASTPSGDGHRHGKVDMRHLLMQLTFVRTPESGRQFMPRGRYPACNGWLIPWNCAGIL
jgi:hypothetical protein